MTVHARLSPSGADRWMACSGAPVLEAPYPDTSSIYAREGTLAHDLAAGHLSKNWKLTEYIGEEWQFDDGQMMVITKELVDDVLGYCERVRSYAHGGSLLVEQQVPISHITGEEHAIGTSDVVVIGNGWIKIADLKYGRGVAVTAEDNAQMQMYALGAIERYSAFDEFAMVSMAIDQPRLGNHISEETTWTIPVAQLLAFRDKAAEAAARVREAEIAGNDEALRPFLNPGSKQCRFCRAKATCPALREEMLLATSGDLMTAATVDEFAQFLPLEIGPETGDNYLAIAMGKVEMVEQWCKAVRAQVLELLAAGKPVDGWKLVAGRQGARKWVDEKAAEEFLTHKFKLRTADRYNMTLVSPTQVEKLCKERNSRILKYERVAGMVTRADGKPSVAPASDKRPAITLVASPEEFAALVGAESED